MKPYVLKAEDLHQIDHIEMAFGTTKFLPKPDQIPKEFYRGNIYTHIAEARFFGHEVPKGTMKIRPEFYIAGIEGKMNMLMTAHLRSWEPKHEDKIAGVGFMLYTICEITSDKEPK